MGFLFRTAFDFAHNHGICSPLRHHSATRPHCEKSIKNNGLNF